MASSRTEKQTFTETWRAGLNSAASSAPMLFSLPSSPRISPRTHTQRRRTATEQELATKSRPIPSPRMFIKFARVCPYYWSLFSSRFRFGCFTTPTCMYDDSQGHITISPESGPIATPATALNHNLRLRTVFPLSHALYARKYRRNYASVMMTPLLAG